MSKKSQKYNDIVRVIAEMETKKQAEKDRIGTVMIAELDDDTAALLGGSLGLRSSARHGLAAPPHWGVCCPS